MDVKKAFTLAETLITLGIIGVIAALTIPVLQSFSDEQKFVNLTKKSYTTLQSATSILETKYGDLEFWPWSNNDEIKKRYESVMNAIPYSGEIYSTTTLDGALWGSRTGDGWIQTTDGMLFAYSQWEDRGRKINIFYVDVNGEAAPNKVGVDVHAFFVDNSGVFPLNTKINYANSYWGCTYYVIKAGKMPWIDDASYSHCGDPRIDNI